MSEVHFQSVVPILRIFDIAKAEEFYLGYLGFKTDWDHRFSDKSPLYRQISRSGIVLHLSEHHGDGSPGANIRILVASGLVEYHKTLTAQDYRYMKPGLDEGMGPGSLEIGVVDSFGNRVTFCQDGKE